MKYTKDNPKLIECYFSFKRMKIFTGVVKDEKNTIAYYLNGNFHREDGPAVIYDNSYQAWYLNGKYHRTDGPAVEWGEAREWCLNGEFYGYNNDYTNESWIRFVQLEILK